MTVAVDLVVIGAGTAGIPAGIEAADRGARVVLIEKHSRVGGIQDGRPSRGLYAVGEILGASQFMGDSSVGGMSVGPAVTLGRLAGQQLARESVAR